MTAPHVNHARIIALLDYTLLDEHATPEQLQSFQKKAMQWPVAAVCVYPTHLPLFQTLTTAKRATVVNFPSGSLPLEKVMAEMVNAHALGAQEIDYVFPYAQFVCGEQQKALTHLKAIHAECQKRGLTLKVIVESGVFTDMSLLADMAASILDVGCDFLKTSTGKVPKGATLEAAKVLLRAILSQKAPTGLKCSGGIHTIEQAHSYIALAEDLMGKKADASWFRIGASRLLDALTGSLP